MRSIRHVVYVAHPPPPKGSRFYGILCPLLRVLHVFYVVVLLEKLCEMVLETDAGFEASVDVYVNDLCPVYFWEADDMRMNQ